MEDKCIQYGLRTKNGKELYCDISGELLQQKAEAASCQNDFECLSNSCSNGACVDLAKEIRESRNILEKILA